MNDEDDRPLEPGAAVTQATDDRSLISRIQARRDDREDILTIEIPSWGGDLKAKYRVVERVEIEKMMRRARSNAGSGDGKNSAIQADCDFLIGACVGVIAVDPETGNEIDLSDGYSLDLAEKLGNPPNTDTARGLVLHLVKNNSIALASHGQRVARWMQDTSKPVEDPQ